MDTKTTTLSSWEFILGKMLDIRQALLRFKSRKDQITQPVHVAGLVNSTSVEVLTGTDLFQGKLVNHAATLVQRTTAGSLYVYGFISHVHDKENAFLLNVTRAQWFENKQRGAQKWLEEVCTYQKIEGAHL